MKTEFQIRQFNGQVLHQLLQSLVAAADDVLDRLEWKQGADHWSKDTSLS